MNELFTTQKSKDICREQGISYLGLFGSYARGDNKVDSDVDLLVEFSRPTGYFGLLRAQRELGEYLGREVDLVTKGALSKRIFPYIEKDLKAVYGADYRENHPDLPWRDI